MRFINLTRRTEIGANSYFLELDGKKLVLDAAVSKTTADGQAMPLMKKLKRSMVGG